MKAPGVKRRVAAALMAVPWVLGFAAAVAVVVIAWWWALNGLSDEVVWAWFWTFLGGFACAFLASGLAR